MVQLRRRPTRDNDLLIKVSARASRYRKCPEADWFSAPGVATDGVEWHTVRISSHVAGDEVHVMAPRQWQPLVA